ncbi:hypothetical protein PMKS-001353 [Pichia membranifaciens]|uniref:Uncharacterized protein n=1 Tax=Pichia membranifaciens TaxID=4926 RepID=A0A1Q2YEF4_9ASCO|nr:hypothetical protein PMKS-001353 [Pichia membranifaciens]
MYCEKVPSELNGAIPTVDLSVGADKKQAQTLQQNVNGIDRDSFHLDQDLFRLDIHWDGDCRNTEVPETGICECLADEFTGGSHRAIEFSRLRHSSR